MQNNVGIYASQISGHLWAPNGAYDALATATVPSGGAASITFSGIPQGYKHLQIRASWKDGSEIAFSYNGDTTSTNYWRHYLQGSGSGSPQVGVQNNNGVGGYSGSSTYFTGSIIDILDYSNTSKNKVSRCFWGFDANGSGYVGLTSGVWNNTSAVTSITITNTMATNFAQYSQFALYGVK